MATIKDVAKKANVSIATVSHVLNDTKFVSVEVKERVYIAIKETGYIPNNIARSLKIRKTKTIGMIVAYIENPIYSGIFREVESMARDKGYSVMVCNSNDDPDVEASQIKLLLSNRVDGLIIVPARNSRIPREGLIPDKFPVVFLNRTLEDYEVPSVVIENEAAAYEAVSHLIREHDYRDIAIVIGEKTNRLSRERINGYVRALRENGLSLDEKLVYEGYSTFQGGVNAAKKMFASEFPEAAFVAGTTMLLGVMFQLKVMGVICPGDVALIGFSDTNMNLLMDPPISSVAQPIKLLSETSLSKLMLQIENNKFDAETTILPCKINYRRSCGCEWQPFSDDSIFEQSYLNLKKSRG